VGCRGSFNGWSEARLFFAQLTHSAFSSAQGFPAAVDIAIERTFSSLRRFGLGRVLSLCRGRFFFAVAVTVCFPPQFRGHTGVAARPLKVLFRPRP